MPQDVVATLRELDKRDRDLAAEADRQRRLDAVVLEIRARADEIADFFAGHATEEDRLRQIEAREIAALDERRVELGAARSELEQAHSGEQRTLAEKRLARAADRVALAERAVERTRAERQAFDEQAQRLTRELPNLEERARVLGATTDDLVDWAAGKHAELFVALGQLDQQRERVIREANELATSLLGEPTFGSTPAQALDRVERYWTSSPGQVSDSR